MATPHQSLRWCATENPQHLFSLSSFIVFLSLSLFPIGFSLHLSYLPPQIPNSLSHTHSRLSINAPLMLWTRSLSSPPLHGPFPFFLFSLRCLSPARDPPIHLAFSSWAVTPCTRRASLAVTLPLDFGLLSELSTTYHPTCTLLLDFLTLSGLGWRGTSRKPPRLPFKGHRPDPPSSPELSY
jgi:hypothetical protein